MVIRYTKIIFICLRHGINPFSPVGKNIGKVAERFSENEKKFYIDICKSEYTKEYLRKAFYGWLYGTVLTNMGLDMLKKNEISKVDERIRENAIN